MGRMLSIFSSDFTVDTWFDDVTIACDPAFCCYQATASSFSTTVAPVEAKDIDWEGGWMSYRDLFGGKPSEVRCLARPPPPPPNVLYRLHLHSG